MELLDEPRALLRRASATSQTRNIILRIVACVVLSVFAVRQVKIDEVIERANLHLLLAVALGALLISASAWPQAKRWRIIANTFHVRLGRWPALRATLISFFLVAVTPSTVAADSARVIALRSTGSDWTRSIHSVLIDRLVGLVTVLLLALVGMALLLAEKSSLRSLIGFPVCIAAGAAASGVVLLTLRPPRAWLRSRVIREWIRFVRALRTTLTDRQFQFGGSLCSLLIIAFSMTAFWLIAAAAGARADIATILELFPIVLLTSVLPVSVGGWGSRELGLVAIYPYFGTERPVAMAVSISFGLATLAAGLVCIAASWWIGRGGVISEEVAERTDNEK